MGNFGQKADNATMALLAIGFPAFVVFIAIIGMVKSCVETKPDPMDHSINKRREIVEHILVTDSMHNGFRVVYATVDNVTDERLEEIRHRPAIRQGFQRLQYDAPKHFGGSLLEADIYEFAIFAKQYDVDRDIAMHNIFVTGVAKRDMYVRPNPKIPDCATWMNYGTEQGNQYISANDIYYRYGDEDKRYRYWKCSFPHDMSLTDERFSHFSESERLWRQELYFTVLLAINALKISI